MRLQLEMDPYRAPMYGLEPEIAAPAPGCEEPPAGVRWLMPLAVHSGGAFKGDKVGH